MTKKTATQSTTHSVRTGHRECINALRGESADPVRYPHDQTAPSAAWFVIQQVGPAKPDVQRNDREEFGRYYSIETIVVAERYSEKLAEQERDRRNALDDGHKYLVMTVNEYAHAKALVMGGELCAGDQIRGVADLFRLLRRGREYLVEADRQLRDGGTPDEQAARTAWYADMDANDEWTGLTADAHAACVQDIILCFEQHANFIQQFDGKPHLIDGTWMKLNVARDLAELRESVLKIEQRIAAQSSQH